jgi:hypothetical protein
MKHQEDLVDRLTRFYREAKLEVPASPPAWIPSQRRSRPTWQPVLASAGGGGVARDQATVARVTASPTIATSTAPTTTPSASATPSPSPDASWVTQRYPVGPVSALLLDPSAVFALYAPAPSSGPYDSSLTKLARIDRTTGAITTGGAFPNAAGMARVSAGLWIVAGPGQTGTTSATRALTLVDAVSLAVKRQPALPGQAGTVNYLAPQLAGSAGMLWFAYGNRAYRLNPDTGATILSQSLPGVATSLSLDASKQLLYIGIEAPDSSAGGQDQVLAMNATTGAALASAQTGGRGLGGPHVSAAPDGVWISYATGMAGAVEHRSTSLSALAGSSVRFPIGVATGPTNGIQTFVGGGALWFIDGMARGIACADSSTGAIRASTGESSPEAFTADASGAYLGDFQGVDALQPPASCRG